MKGSVSGHRDVTVMTMNVYFGVDLEPVFAARNLPELIETVAGVWAHVQATDISARATSIAREIAAADPDLVGLQELAEWSIGKPGAMSPRFDFLLLILEALQQEGAFYAPIAIRKDLDQTAPLDMNGTLLRFEDRHAVLLRIEPLPTQVRPYNIQSETFTRLLETASPLMGSLRVPRSWISELNRRLDLVLTRGAIAPISAKLVGADPDARTPSGVWPADHAAVLAKLHLQ
ncbi:MAG TPA: endonuclease/exonuclease/phosphatase family protein [Candidatus Binataceae bacterium]|nr:endonuclease/exonuclease/phosphatase family protein [Candidatus Binataceae bacterium]